MAFLVSWSCCVIAEKYDRGNAKLVYQDRQLDGTRRVNRVVNGHWAVHVQCEESTP